MNNLMELRHNCDSDGPPPPPPGPGGGSGSYSCGGGGGPGGDCGPDGCPRISNLTVDAHEFINNNSIEYYYEYFIPATGGHGYHIKGNDNSITCIREAPRSTGITFNTDTTCK